MASKATVVSLLPYEITPEHPGSVPGRFIIPAAKEGDVTVVVIGDSYQMIPVPLQKEFRKNIELSDSVAESICKDHANSLLAIDREPLEEEQKALPGLFWVEGEYTKADLLTKHKNRVELARKQQNNWFLRLVKIADDEWQRYHQHQMITDMQRMAARSLKAQGHLKTDRDWAADSIEMLEQAKLCPACRTQVHADQVLCHVCKAVLDPVKFKTLTFAGA